MRDAGKKRLFGYIALVIAILAVAACHGEPTDKVRLISAGLHMKKSEIGKAADLVEEVLTNDPENAEAHFLKGSISMARKDLTQASRSFGKAIELNPDFAEARLNLAKLLLAAKQYDQARSHIDRVVSQEPENAEARLLKASQLVSQHQAAQAEAILDDLKAAGNTSPELFLLLAGVKERQSDIQAAESILKAGLSEHEKDPRLHLAMVRLYSAAGRKDDAVAQMKTLIASAPDRKEYTLALALLHWEREEFDLADQVLQQMIADAPQAHEVRLAAANFYLERRQVQKAEAMLLEGIRDLPQAIELYLGLNRLYQVAGQPQKGIEQLLAFLGTNPRPPANDVQKAALVLAQSYFQIKAFERAAHFTAMVLDEHPDQWEALYLKGRIEMAQGRMAQAVSALTAVVAAQPRFEEAHIQLAQAHSMEADYASAVGVLQNGARLFPASKAMRHALARAHMLHKDYKSAETVYQALLTIDPSDAEIQAEVGGFFETMKDTRRAEREYAEIISKYPNKDLGYIRLARLYAGQKDYVRATTELMRGHAVNPDSAGLLTELVRVHLAAEDAQAAEKLCRQRLERNTNEAFSHNLLGQIQAWQKRFDEAREAYRQAIDLAPRWEEPSNNLAALYLRQNKKDEAMSHLAASLSKYPHNRVAYLTLGGLYEQAGKFQKAMDIYNQALDANPDFGGAAHRLAFLLCEYGKGEKDLERALQLALQAYQAESGRADIVDTLGWIYYRKGDNERALRLIGQVVRVLPDNPLANYHLGMVLLDSGNRVEAKARLEAALKTSLPFAGRETAEKTLESLKTAG